ncbi:hypothetical protein VNO77_44008 [Canavalia gladiata]|uniref:Uncharacterized protein n=1 Tax=Canavalia gladiata TaxID=3824 RepID=A0AAN9JXH2_CANGL
MQRRGKLDDHQTGHCLSSRSSNRPKKRGLLVPIRVHDRIGMSLCVGWCKEFEKPEQGTVIRSKVNLNPSILLKKEQEFHVVRRKTRRSNTRVTSILLQKARVSLRHPYLNNMKDGGMHRDPGTTAGHIEA